MDIPMKNTAVTTANAHEFLSWANLSCYVNETDGYSNKHTAVEEKKTSSENDTFDVDTSEVVLSWETTEKNHNNRVGIYVKNENLWWVEGLSDNLGSILPPYVRGDRTFTIQYLSIQTKFWRKHCDLTLIGQIFGESTRHRWPTLWHNCTYPSMFTYIYNLPSNSRILGSL